MLKNKIDLIVTRHPALVEFAKEQGLTSEDVLVKTHVTAGDVVSRHVLGVLPMHLAALTHSITEAELALSLEQRGRELGLDELKYAFRGWRTYRVIQDPDD